jgi:DNA end-binding protein Ku
LAAIRPQDGRLLLSTMVYADEINDPTEIGEIADLTDVDLPEKELAMAAQLIESLASDFEPDKFHDTYREAVLELIEKKASGEEIIAPAAEEEPAKVVDLMAALEASVAAAKDARKRHPTGREGDGAAADGEAPPKRARATKKKAAAKSA